MKKVGVDISPSDSWHKDLARLIEHNRMRNFPEVLHDTLKHLVSFDFSLFATYKYSYKPVVVLSTHSRRLQPTLARYIDELYILDPLFNAFHNGLGAGIYRLREICPDSFENTEYYLSIYHEFDLVDEVILVIPVDNDVVFTVSLGRKSHLGTITRAERNTLNSIFPVISALVRQFWIAQSSEYVYDEQSRSFMEFALTTFGSGVLTQREQEITVLILLGYSSKSIAQQLDISPGTVKVHRKNIYARLNISTQSQLFSMFLNYLVDLTSQ